ncbi:hypothetical protein KSF_107620 [Reticulibacter mediterranei]|uniref:Uncharacterized protein n=1 Tax=Reticulibacter mediterranei TaxID=2778369 RepID=A0A8J3IZA7_9CHLR|nr:hypothetical protein [Reticulibacter mediterranei]GHP00715.1 hypothetical protein KSF_107620 [Reticulibacter mediterranei]
MGRLNEIMHGFYANNEVPLVVKEWQTQFGEMGIYHYKHKGTLMLGVITNTGKSYYHQLVSGLEEGGKWHDLTEQIVAKNVRDISVIAEFAGVHEHHE